MSSVRILLADDHTLVRAGIRSLIESLEGVTIVAEADNGRDGRARSPGSTPRTSS
jgi:DNA-binding NarL/FixJ family response regulator